VVTTHASGWNVVPSETVTVPAAAQLPSHLAPEGAAGAGVAGAGAAEHMSQPAQFFQPHCLASVHHGLQAVLLSPFNVCNAPTRLETPNIMVNICIDEIILKQTKKVVSVSHFGRALTKDFVTTPQG